MAEASKPVWLETWQITMFDDPEVRVDAGNADRTDRARIAAAAPALVRALLRIEWGAHVDHDYYRVRACPACAEERIFNDWAARLKFEHKAGCHVDAALTAAGFPDQASRDAARAILNSEAT